MPELPEVETVKESLKRKVQNCKIVSVILSYPRLIEAPTAQEFRNKIIGETIHDIKRRGKWLIFELDHYDLLSHLRMEGRYVFRHADDPMDPHEHVAFLLQNGEELRYKDTRKFGRMYLLPKETVWNLPPLINLGLEPWDSRLTASYLKRKLKEKRIPIKTSLLDQSIIAGIGNIYANEILFCSKLNPHKESNRLTKLQLEAIIQNTRKVLGDAILQGGTTIRTYESSEGIHGRFQQNLFVHGKAGQACLICGTIIQKVTIGSRGTYYCPTCQK